MEETNKRDLPYPVWLALALSLRSAVQHGQSQGLPSLARSNWMTMLVSFTPRLLNSVSNSSLLHPVSGPAASAVARESISPSEATHSRTSRRVTIAPLPAETNLSSHLQVTVARTVDLYHKLLTSDISLVPFGRIVGLSECAVKRRWSSAGEQSRPGAGSFHPVAIEAAAEATKLLKPSV